MLKQSPHPRDLAPFLRRGVTNPQGSGLRMGLQQITQQEWLDRGAFYMERLVAKRAVLEACPESVQVLPQACAAVAELCRLLGHNITDNAQINLATLGLTTFEDLCLLEPHADTHVLSAATLAFPTDWHLGEKLGLPLIDIHAPITGYAGKLAQGVEHFFNNLKPGALFMRSNWFIAETNALRYLPKGPAEQRFAAIRPEYAGQTLFLRCERQTLCRLPMTKAVLFAIGVYICPLEELSMLEVAMLLKALETLPDFEFERREAHAFYPIIQAYAQILSAQAE